MVSSLGRDGEEMEIRTCEKEQNRHPMRVSETSAAERVSSTGQSRKSAVEARLLAALAESQAEPARVWWAWAKAKLHTRSFGSPHRCPASQPSTLFDSKSHHSGARAQLAPVQYRIILQSFFGSCRSRRELKQQS